MRFVVTDMEGQNGTRGYTLIELLVVIVIIGILATQAIFMLTSVAGKIKAAAFKLRNDIQWARSEAVRRNATTRISFLFDTTINGEANRDGYRVWIDTNNDSAYSAGTDTLLREVPFDEEVQFYDLTVAAPAGPGKNVDGDPWPASPDGVTFSADRFALESDGTVDNAGTVYMYAPAGEDSATVLKNPPFAAVVSPTGRVRMVRWRPETGASGAWSSN